MATTKLIVSSVGQPASGRFAVTEISTAIQAVLTPIHRVSLDHFRNEIARYQSLSNDARPDQFAEVLRVTQESHIRFGDSYSVKLDGDSDGARLHILIGEKLITITLVRGNGQNFDAIPSIIRTVTGVHPGVQFQNVACG